MNNENVGIILTDDNTIKTLTAREREKIEKKFTKQKLKKKEKQEISRKRLYKES